MESFPRKWNPHFLSAPITCMWGNFYLCGNESRTLPHRKVFPWEWKHVTQTSPRENGLQILTLSLFKIQNARVALSVAILCEKMKNKVGPLPLFICPVYEQVSDRNPSEVCWHMLFCK